MDSNDMKDPVSGMKQDARTSKMVAEGNARNWIQSLIDKILRR